MKTIRCSTYQYWLQPYKTFANILISFHEYFDVLLPRKTLIYSFAHKKLHNFIFLIRLSDLYDYHHSLKIVLKTKDFVKSVENFWTAVRSIKENSKTIFLSLSFLWASRWSSPTKSFYNVKWLTNEMFFCQRHIAYQIKLLNKFTLSFVLNFSI